MAELRPWIALLGRYRGSIAVGTLLILATLVAGVGLLAASGWFITATGLTGLALAAGFMVSLEVYVPSGLIRFFAIGRTLARYAERLVNHDIILRLLADLRSQLFRRLLPLDPGALSRFRSADLLNRITADIDTLDALYLRILGPSVAALLVLGVSAAVGAWLWPGVVAPVVAWLLLAGFGLPALAALAGRRTGEALVGVRGELRGLALDGFAGLAELRVFGGWQRQQQQLFEVEGRYRQLSRRLAMAESGGGAVATLAGQAGVALTAALGILAWEQGTVSGPVLGLLVLGALGLAEALQPLPGAWFQWGRTRAAARRLNEVVATAPGIPEPARPRSPTREHDLSLDGIHLRWQPHMAPVLDGIDWRLPDGRTVVISGPSGVGKSTLAALCARLVAPDRGEIRLGGVPLGEMATADLYRRIACLTQQSELFADTVAGNLRIARPDAGDDALWQALEVADLADTVAALPDGLATRVGEGGARLSGGQARRLALARVILRDTPVVILDEPDAGLDAGGAARLGARLGPWLERRTALVISHAPAAMALPAHHCTLSPRGIRPWR